MAVAVAAAEAVAMAAAVVAALAVALAVAGCGCNCGGGCGWAVGAARPMPNAAPCMTHAHLAPHATCRKPHAASYMPQATVVYYIRLFVASDYILLLYII